MGKRSEQIPHQKEKYINGNKAYGMAHSVIHHEENSN
jgi:hypothetical protein